MERFPNKEKLEQNELQIIDIVPEKEKYPVPVLVAPGWATTTKDLENFSKLLSEKGRRVLSFSHSRENIVGGPLSLLRSKKEITEAGKEYSFEEIQKAFSLLEVLENKNIDKADVVAHSEAGINVSIAASEYPEKFRNIVYVNPAGMIGEDKFPKLLGRFSTESIKSAFNSFLKSENRGSVKTQWKESINYITKNIPLSWKEAVAISKSDIKEMLKSLKEKGIGISIVHTEGDNVFPIEKMKEKVGSVIDDNFIQYEGDHFDIIFNPEKVTDLIDNALIKSEDRK